MLVPYISCSIVEKKKAALSLKTKKRKIFPSYSWSLLLTITLGLTGIFEFKKHFKIIITTV